MRPPKESTSRLQYMVVWGGDYGLGLGTGRLAHGFGLFSLKVHSMGIRLT